MLAKFERLLTMLRKDIRTSRRDQIVLYMLCSPLLIGLGLAFLMPVLEQATPGFAVDRALSEDRIAVLAELGPVERFATRDEVETRVLERDDLLGVVGSAGGYEVLIEGDEPEPLRSLPALALERGVDPDQLSAGTAELREISTSLAAYAIVVIVGLILGFTILEEKQTETHRVYTVTPLRFGEYLLGKLGLGVVLAMILVVPTVALPMGLDLDWLVLVILIVSGAPFGLSLGLIVGVRAKDQLGAIAIMKALLPIWTSLPVLGFVLPEPWMWTLWPFANHWTVQGLYHALGDGGSVVGPASLGLLTGLPVMVVVAWLLRRRLGFAE